MLESGVCFCDWGWGVKILIAAVAALLVGCSEPLTYAQLVTAEEWCKARNMTPKARGILALPATGPRAVQVICIRADGVWVLSEGGK